MSIICAAAFRSYRLSRVLRDHPALGDVGRITLLDSLASVRLVLWDETRRRLISFRQLRFAVRLSLAGTAWCRLHHPMCGGPFCEFENQRVI